MAGPTQVHDFEDALDAARAYHDEVVRDFVEAEGRIDDLEKEVGNLEESVAEAEGRANDAEARVEELEREANDA